MLYGEGRNPALRRIFGQPLTLLHSLAGTGAFVMMDRQWLNQVGVSPFRQKMASGLALDFISIFGALALAMRGAGLGAKQIRLRQAWEARSSRASRFYWG
jgi:hypothetical protein